MCGDRTADGPDRLWRLLEQAERRWLLVIDNADDIEMLASPAVPAAAGERAARPSAAPTWRRWRTSRSSTRPSARR